MSAEDKPVAEAKVDEGQMMIVPWKDPVLASVVEVANYYSENVQQDEIAEESQDIVPEKATSSVPQLEATEKSGDLSIIVEEVVEEVVRSEDIEMVEKAIVEEDAEERRKMTLLQSSR